MQVDWPMGDKVTIQKNWQELIRPNKLQVTPGGDATRFATLVAEPLERGFGQTLGNALRRVLAELDPQQAIQLLLDRTRGTASNAEFLRQIQLSA